MTVTNRPLVLPAAWLLAFTALSTAPVLRIGDVQILEMAQALAAGGAAASFVRAGCRTRVPEAWRQYGLPCLALLFLCGAFSLLALRLDFYPPAEASALKQPLVLSLARLLELALAALSMLSAASAMRRNPPLLRLALDVYCWIAAATAVASILSWVLLIVGRVPTPLVYGFDSRVRGLFNEGGPFGMFLISAAVAAVLRARHFVPIYGFRTRALLLLFGIALLLSGSKAGLLSAVLLCGIAGIVSGGRRQRVALVSTALAIFTATVVIFPGKFLNYWFLYENFQEAAAYHPDDPNFVMGRVAGALIVPRMIAAHPLAGIGLGNYSLMRNDPQYLEGMPVVQEWDLPGMGLLGATAELGVPLSLLLYAFLLWPLCRSVRSSAPAALAVAAAFQPVAFLLGVNLNFFYPWLITAFALAQETAR
jgi:hypothetical protein